jgi:hypothetical protein
MEELTKRLIEPAIIYAGLVGLLFLSGVCAVLRTSAAGPEMKEGRPTEPAR